MSEVTESREQNRTYGSEKPRLELGEPLTTRPQNGSDGLSPGKAQAGDLNPLKGGLVSRDLL